MATKTNLQRELKELGLSNKSAKLITDEQGTVIEKNFFNYMFPIIGSTQLTIDFYNLFVGANNYIKLSENAQATYLPATTVRQSKKRSYLTIKQANLIVSILINGEWVQFDDLGVGQTISFSEKIEKIKIYSITDNMDCHYNIEGHDNISIPWFDFTIRKEADYYSVGAKVQTPYMLMKKQLNDFFVKNNIKLRCFDKKEQGINIGLVLYHLPSSYYQETFKVGKKSTTIKVAAFESLSGEEELYLVNSNMVPIKAYEDKYGIENLKELRNERKVK